VIPSNKRVIILKDKDVISNGRWHVAIEIGTELYENAIANIRNDLAVINRQHAGSEPVVELRQIGVSVSTLEARLAEFRQLLPKPDKRRGLINLGGSVLKTLFGTATVADFYTLHTNLEELKLREADTSHSVNNQLTYIKELNLNSRMNWNAIANLSNILKDEMVQLHSRYTRLASDLWQFNVSFQDHSFLIGLVRQMEFSLLQLTVQIDELNMAIQNTLVGKLPVAILKPSVLHDVLKNISLILPENFGLVAGIKIENIHLYYELIKASVIGDAHGLKLVLEIPLKMAGQIFTVYRIVALPTEILNGTFAKYKFDSDFFVLANGQRDYLLMTEREARKCTTDSVAVCPADKALLDVQTPTCESQLFFQKAVREGTCRRHLLVNYEAPTLLRHQDVCIYHFPRQRQVTIRCPHDGTWKIDTQTLFGAGLIRDATTCEVATNEVRTMPELHGATRLHLDAPPVYAPAEVPILSPRELPNFDDCHFSER
jgi:hypothetical protein